MILFQLGRQPEIGLAEIETVYSKKPQLIQRHFALLDVAKDAALASAWRLGSVVKIMSIIDGDFSLDAKSAASLSKKIFADVSGKVTVGLSLYGFHDASKTSHELGDIVKGILSEMPNISSVRLLLDKSGALSTATVLHNGLARENNKKVELDFVKDGDKIIVAATLFVQNIDSYTVRDREKPRRDARNGMLPPKLAQTIINLSVGARNLPGDAPLSLYDPFCGTGTILIEAALMRKADRTSPLFARLVGSDLNPQMMDNTKVNLAWADKRLRASASERTTLFVADATGSKNTPDEQSSSTLSKERACPLLSTSPTFSPVSRETKCFGVNIVATECYLGRPYTTPPSNNELTQNIKTCDIIIGKFLQNISAVLPQGAGLCVAVPCWQVRGKIYHLPCLKNIEHYRYNKQLGYGLVYRRPEQIVGRELAVVRKML